MFQERLLNNNVTKKFINQIYDAFRIYSCD
jgi:methyl coenzyme M reductase subunit D